MSRPGLTQERLVALFLLGVLLFTPPFLGIFNRPDRIFGIPSLYLYLFAAWTMLIVLVTLAIESSNAEEAEAEETAEGPPHGSKAGNGGTGV
jgi:hypothetical protein